MSDFTKEELVLMQLAINGYQSYDNHYPEALEPLFHKLQSLIDNYCEITIPTMADYCCSKCNEEWHNCECKK